MGTLLNAALLLALMGRPMAGGPAAKTHQDPSPGDSGTPAKTGRAAPGAAAQPASDSSAGEAARRGSGQDSAAGAPQDLKAAAAESAAAEHLRLGQMYARKKRYADARAAYLKALESTSPARRDSAARALAGLLGKEESGYEKWVRDPFLKAMAALALAIVTGVAVLALYWLLRQSAKPVGRIRGRGKLRIEPLTRYLPATLDMSFEEALREIHAEMAEQAEPIGALLPSLDRHLPVVLWSDTGPIADLVEPALGPGLGKVMAQALSAGRSTEYTLSGVAQSNGTHVHLVARLARWGKTAESWETTFLAADFVNAQKDFAYKVLMSAMEKIRDADAS